MSACFGRIAQTESGQRAIRRAIWRLRFRVAYLAARRMLLQLWNLPREIMELPEGHPHRLIAASVVLYALTAVAILAGVVRLVTTP